MAPSVIVARVGPAHYRTIGDAIRAAQPGAEILVRPGLYRESLVLDK
jgi:F-box protein 11